MNFKTKFSLYAEAILVSISFYECHSRGTRKTLLGKSDLTAFQSVVADIKLSWHDYSSSYPNNSKP